MNNNLQNFMNNLGILCEIWTLTYNKFIQLGFDHKAAMEHTKEFMAAFTEAALRNNGGAQ